MRPLGPEVWGPDRATPCRLRRLIALIAHYFPAAAYRDLVRTFFQMAHNSQLVDRRNWLTDGTCTNRCVRDDHGTWDVSLICSSSTRINQWQPNLQIVITLLEMCCDQKREGRAEAPSRMLLTLKVV